jgi:hypothetical protein
MEAALTAETSTALPLRLRLRRALIIALILALWAPVKIAWEQRIAREQDQLRYNGAKVTIALRDQLSQGLALAVLAGMRNIVADMVWLGTVTSWMHQDWWRMAAVIDTCTALQPRAPMFWDMGGWQLAWNASIFSSIDANKYPSELQRKKAERFWIERGKDVLLRGLQHNPDYWRLWFSTALLYDQRLKDWKTAATYYQRASEVAGAPIYIERAPAHMYDKAHLNDPAQEYAEWVKLWQRLTPEQKANPQHIAPVIVRNIQGLEQKLDVPKEKRIFPN